MARARFLCECRPRCASLSECHAPKEAEEVERVCCECGGPALFGEPTCGNVECLESLNASLLVDLDGDERRAP